MLSSTLKWGAAILVSLAPAFLHAQVEGYAQPDSILLENGSSRRGVIVKNTARSVFLQERDRISEFPKSGIVRIFDGVDVGMEFVEAGREGDLPSWRVMVNDIRNNDAIKSVIQIPATLIDNGYLQNVPYLSFRINQHIEMNVYGSPENPAAIEFGVYGKQSSSDKIRRTLRSFMAGFLSSRKEVAAIYSIPFSGGEKSAGDFRIRITPASAPDAYGAWWICLYNPDTLREAKVGDAEYAKLTLPPHEVMDRSGRLKASFSKGLNFPPRSGKRANSGDATSRHLPDFMRDPGGWFRVLLRED